MYSERNKPDELWEYGEDNDGWYVGPPGEQVGYACSQQNAERIVACVNACRGIPTDELLGSLPALSNGVAQDKVIKAIDSALNLC